MSVNHNEGKQKKSVRAQSSNIKTLVTKNVPSKITIYVRKDNCTQSKHIIFMDRY
jgi:hypothetical protein